MRTGENRIDTLHPDPAKSGVPIERDIYVESREAILAALDENGELAFGELASEVEARARPGTFDSASVRWYTTRVKLDLEARGLIERVPRSSPQRLRRTNPRR